MAEKSSDAQEFSLERGGRSDKLVEAEGKGNPSHPRQSAPRGFGNDGSTPVLITSQSWGAPTITHGAVSLKHPLAPGCPTALLALLAHSSFLSKCNSLEIARELCFVFLRITATVAASTQDYSKRKAQREISKGQAFSRFTDSR